MTLPPSYVALQVDEIGAATATGDLDIAFNNGDYSISAWIQYDGFSSNAIIIQREGEFVFRTTDNGFAFQIEGRPPLTWQSATDLGNDWINVCITVSEGNARLFVNGEFQSYVALGTGSTTTQNPLIMGTGLQGLIRNVVVYNTDLGPDQVLQSQFNPPSSSLVAAYFDFTQNPPVDTGPKHLPINLSSGAKSVRVTPCMQFTPGSFAYPMHDPDINPGGHSVDSYTVQSWIYLRESAPVQYVLANSDLNSDTGMSLSVVETDGSFKLVSKRGSDQSGASVISSQTIALRTWTNVATTFDGATLTVFINGTAVGSKACPPLPLMRNAGDVVIGATFSDTIVGGIDTIQGCISHLNVWNSALPVAQIVHNMTAHPEGDLTALTGNFNLTSIPSRNSVNGHPVGLVGGAHVFQHVANSVVGAEDADFAREVEAEYTATPEMLARWRSEIDFDAHREMMREALSVARAKDADHFESEEDRQKIHAAYDDVMRRVELGDHPEMPLLFTRHEENGRRYLVGNDGAGSFVAYEGDAAAISDCTLWEIQLIFVVLFGILDALFGLKASLSPRARSVIAKILLSPRVAAYLARGGAITAVGIFGLMSAMVASGHIKSLLWALVDIGIWTFIRVVGRLVLDFFGVGAASVIASLAATVVTFISTYAQRPSSCDPIPKVTLASITFNHDPTHSSVDALSIRKSGAVAVKIPEWTHGMTDPMASPAAYAIDKVRSKTITLEASFTIDTQAATTVQIQALNGGVLGAIAPVTVNFVNGVSNPQFVTLSLPNHQIATAGVKAQNASWTWQYKVSTGGWNPMTTSNHRIYTVLSQPTMPWQQDANPAETQLPWTTALEHACAWAAGKTTSDAVLSAITTKVYESLGLTYETVQGESKYTGPNGAGTQFAFYLTQFLKYLKGSGGNGKVVNCTDCASIVTSFANLVGTNVQASIMQDNRFGDPQQGFKCNKIQAIGDTTWRYPFSPKNIFSYHEVVWEPATGNFDNIYDACLKFDSGNDPWKWTGGGTHVPVLPLKFPFTSQPLPTTLPIATPFTAQTYRERLAQNSAAGIGKCIPQGPIPHSQSGRRMVE
ncbi:MAG: LamG-like jellyroll fold domain-containing protein [Pseudomonadota bacterium]